jgi:TPR repeat protein
MRVALRLIALAVALAAAGAAAAGTKQPSLASIGATAPGEGDDYLAAASLCASLVDQVNAKDRSGSNSFRESTEPDWRPDEKTIADCRSAADRGDAAAAYALGVMYRKGLGVPRDSTQAAKWLRKSADLGLARAETSLGAIYALGEGVPQSRAEAIKWTRAAAEQGDARAQYVLGLMYCDGQGDPQDLVQAHMWLNLAAAQGLRQAGAARDQVAAWIGSPAEIAKAQQMAVERGAAASRLAGEYQLRP